MPSVKDNIEVWNKYNWKSQGEEWSDGYGGSQQQWLCTLYPRIHSFIPCQNILEIGVGCGRWTYYLQKYCKNYTGVDLCSRGITICKQKFPNLNFFVNDGKTLNDIKDNSIDFCFSFDSLIHAEIDTMDSYIAEILKKLKDDGIAFIEHSNMSDLKDIPANHCYNATTVSSKKIKKLIKKYGGSILVQENFNYCSDLLTDAFTVFHKNKNKYGCSQKIIENYDFTKEQEFSNNIVTKYIPNYKKQNHKNIKDVYFENYPYGKPKMF